MTGNDTIGRYPRTNEPDTRDDAGDPDTFYCANCNEYFRHKTKGFYYRIQEIAEHECGEGRKL